MSDGAQVAIELFGRHADARVGNGDRAGILVEGHENSQFIGRQLNIGIGQALEVELIDRIGSVGDELTQEDLAVRIDRVDHQIEELLALCLEFAHGENDLSRDIPFGTLTS